MLRQLRLSAATHHDLAYEQLLVWLSERGLTDQEHLREKAVRNLDALRAAAVETEHAREVVSGIWIRSLSATNLIGGTREELQLDLTRAPTNKAVTMTGAIFVRFNGQGEIEEERRYFDMASMMAQIGITPG